MSTQIDFSDVLAELDAHSYERLERERPILAAKLRQVIDAGATAEDAWRKVINHTDNTEIARWIYQAATHLEAARQGDA